MWISKFNFYNLISKIDSLERSLEYEKQTHYRLRTEFDALLNHLGLQPYNISVVIKEKK